MQRSGSTGYPNNTQRTKHYSKLPPTPSDLLAFPKLTKLFSDTDLKDSRPSCVDLQVNAFGLFHAKDVIGSLQKPLIALSLTNCRNPTLGQRHHSAAQYLELLANPLKFAKAAASGSKYRVSAPREEQFRFKFQDERVAKLPD